MVATSTTPVAVVDADDLGVGLERPVQFGLVVDLDQAVEIELEGLGAEVRKLPVIQHRHDQEHGVGTPGSGFEELVAVDDEILADHRQATGGTRGGEVSEAAAEMGFVGEYRECRGSALLVGLHLAGEVGSRGDVTGTRGAALVLADQRHARAGQRLSEGTVEIAVAEPSFQLAQRDLPLALINAPARG